MPTNGRALLESDGSSDCEDTQNPPGSLPHLQRRNRFARREFICRLNTTGYQGSGLTEGGNIDGQEEFVVDLQRLTMHNVQLARIVGG